MGFPGLRMCFMSAIHPPDCSNRPMGVRTFESIFDSGNTLSIGAIALSLENSDVIYVGTGEGAPTEQRVFWRWDL